jgi:hypothetical protein
LIATGSDPFYRLTSAADGVHFDIDADGTADQVPWTRRNSSVALFAVDKTGTARSRPATSCSAATRGLAHRTARPR